MEDQDQDRLRVRRHQHHHGGGECRGGRGLAPVGRTRHPHLRRDRGDDRLCAGRVERFLQHAGRTGPRIDGVPGHAVQGARQCRDPAPVLPAGPGHGGVGLVVRSRRDRRCGSAPGRRRVDGDGAQPRRPFPSRTLGRRRAEGPCHGTRHRRHGGPRVARRLRLPHRRPGHGGSRHPGRRRGGGGCHPDQRPRGLDPVEPHQRAPGGGVPVRRRDRQRSVRQRPAVRHQR